MIATLLALRPVSLDPYSGFQAHYRAFSKESLYPIGIVEIRSGYDVTSLLYPARERIVAILRRAKAPALFGKANVGLLVRLGREEWAVDAGGTVLVAGHATRLSDADFVTLRETVLNLLPDMRLERVEVDRLITTPKNKAGG